MVDYSCYMSKIPASQAQLRRIKSDHQGEKGIERLTEELICIGVHEAEDIHIAECFERSRFRTIAENVDFETMYYLWDIHDYIDECRDQIYVKCDDHEILKRDYEKISQEWEKISRFGMPLICSSNRISETIKIYPWLIADVIEQEEYDVGHKVVEYEAARLMLDIIDDCMDEKMRKRVDWSLMGRLNSIVKDWKADGIEAELRLIVSESGAQEILDKPEIDDKIYRFINENKNLWSGIIDDNMILDKEAVIRHLKRAELSNDDDLYKVTASVYTFNHRRFRELLVDHEYPYTFMCRDDIIEHELRNKEYFISITGLKYGNGPRVHCRSQFVNLFYSWCHLIVHKYPFILYLPSRKQIKDRMRIIKDYFVRCYMTSKVLR